MSRLNITALVLLSTTFIYSCKVSGPGGIFGKASPHEKYGQLLTTTGLQTTALGREWFTAADNSLANPLQVSIPYKEQGYFPSDKARASAIRFEAKQGQELTISFHKKPAENFNVYIDLWEEKENNRKLVAYADTGQTGFSYEIEKAGHYLLRLQPELLASGEYTLTIISGPSLAFPVKKGKAQSFWGAGRDAGARRHEGVDIFAPFRTPALAAANGTITRVGLNSLGGKVIFLRPDGKNYNLYYAHLDEQLATGGQTVSAGDTIGLIGTTGNAKGGSPHLHFGIYASGGAVDPFPFIDPATKMPEDVKMPTANIGRSMRTMNVNTSVYPQPGTTSSSLIKLPAGSLVEVTAAASSWAKVLLPDGMKGFVKNDQLKQASSPVKRIVLPADRPLFDRPDSLAARKKQIPRGDKVDVLGRFQGFSFVSTGEESGWIKD